MAPKFDVYAHVTDTIIAEIEAGTPPWRKPWTGSTSGIALPKRYNGEAYRGINILMLWVMAAKNGYVSSRWMTYRQAKELGGQVRGGETSATVVKYGTFTRENELGVEEELPYARAYRVFNADQIEGLADDYYARPDAPRDLGTEVDPELAAFFARTGAEIITSEDPRAYYSPAKDHIHMPPIATFHNAAGYYGTLAHETIHWTGSEKRLERIKKFANREAYAFEELVAEIGACFLGAQIGVAPEFGQSAAYVERREKMTAQIERSELGPGPDFGVGLVVGATKEERQMRINFRNQLVMNLNNAVAAFGDWGDLEYFYGSELDILNIDHEYWKKERKARLRLCMSWTTTAARLKNWTNAKFGFQTMQTTTAPTCLSISTIWFRTMK